MKIILTENLHFFELPIEDQDLIKRMAIDHYNKNKGHVDIITESGGEPYRNIKVSPTGADMLYPHLWKGLHWRWFFETYPDAKENKIELYCTLSCIAGNLIALGFNIYTYIHFRGF